MKQLKNVVVWTPVIGGLTIAFALIGKARGIGRQVRRLPVSWFYLQISCIGSALFIIVFLLLLIWGHVLP